MLSAVVTGVWPSKSVDNSRRQSQQSAATITLHVLSAVVTGVWPSKSVDNSRRQSQQSAATITIGFELEGIKPGDRPNVY